MASKNIERSTDKGVLICNTFDYRSWCVSEKDGFTKENAIFEYQNPDLVVAREVKGNTVEKMQSIYRDQSELNLEVLQPAEFQGAYNAHQQYQTKTTSSAFRSLFLLIALIIGEIVLWSLALTYDFLALPPEAWQGWVLLIGIVIFAFLIILEMFVAIRSYQHYQRAIADLDVLAGAMQSTS